MAIAALVLLVAIINYINLATSRAIQRKREVGVRKVTGALRSQLLVQFVTEAVMQSMLALVLAVALTQLLLPIFRQITDRDLELFGQGNAWMLLPAVVLAIVVGIVAGYYPAIQVSSFPPVRALKDEVARGHTFMSLRKFLVSASLS